MIKLQLTILLLFDNLFKHFAKEMTAGQKILEIDMLMSTPITLSISRKSKPYDLGQTYFANVAANKIHYQLVRVS